MEASEAAGKRKRSLAVVIALMSLEKPAEDHALWWNNKLLARAPGDLSDARGDVVERIYYGRASNYGRDHATPMTSLEFYTHFRYAREDIPRLVVALRLPEYRRGGAPDLPAAHELPKPPLRAEARVRLDLRLHLRAEARVRLLEFDHERLQPLMPVFAAAVHKKGSPLTNVWGFIDGTFRWMCRPSLDGYMGVAQQTHYSGLAHGHGLNYHGRGYTGGLYSACCLFLNAVYFKFLVVRS
jgi:hypothetical protein